MEIMSREIQLVHNLETCALSYSCYNDQLPAFFVYLKQISKKYVPNHA